MHFCKVKISAPLLTSSNNNVFSPKYSLLLSFLISLTPILQETIPSFMIYNLSPFSPFEMILVLGGNSFFFNFWATLYFEILSKDSKIDILFKKLYFSFKIISLFLFNNSRQDSLSIAYNSTLSWANTSSFLFFPEKKLSSPKESHEPKVFKILSLFCSKFVSSSLIWLTFLVSLFLIKLTVPLLII